MSGRRQREFKPRARKCSKCRGFKPVDFTKGECTTERSPCFKMLIDAKLARRQALCIF